MIAGVLVITVLGSLLNMWNLGDLVSSDRACGHPAGCHFDHQAEGVTARLDARGLVTDKEGRVS